MAKAIRHSRQRDMIYEYLCGTREHPSAETIYSDLKKSCESLSLATVYRNLRILQGLGQVRAVAIVNGTERFESVYREEHAHFACIECGRVFDIPDVLPDTVCIAAQSPHIGRIDHTTLTLRGVCADCLSKQG